MKKTVTYQKGRNTIGLILRTFATKAEDVPGRVKQIRDFVNIALALDLFKRIDVLVWSDPRYEGADCGQTATAMREALGRDVFVSEFNSGDLFCEILNYGVMLQSRHGIDYSMIASTEATKHMTQGNMRSLMVALEDGARVTGLAISELTESIMEGRIANTFAIWHCMSLMQVGGFDLRAAKPRKNELAKFMRGHSPEMGEEVFYHLAGVEEMIPLIRLTDTFGECIAPVEVEDPSARYTIPDKETNQAEHARHMKKFGTKTERQTALANEVGATLTYVKNGVMDGYRR